VSVWALAAVVAFADDKPPEKAKAPISDDAITAASRDFQRLKAEHGVPVEQAGLGLPGLATPELQLGNGTSTVVIPLPEKPAVKRSPNWLVDGVMKKPEQGPRGISPPGQERSLDQETRDGESKSDEVRSDGGKPDRSERDKPPGPELNPLTRYMAGWMTTQDYALLRPGLSGEVASDVTSRGDPSLMAFGAGSAGDGAKDSLLGISTSQGSPPAAMSAPRENPFLQAFVLPPQPTSAFTPPSAAESSAAAQRRLVAPAEPPPSEKPKVPEIAKPSDDTKYFKQLKRF